MRRVLIIILLALIVQSAKAQFANDTSRIMLSIGAGTLFNTCSLKKDYDNSGIYLPQKEFEIGATPGIGITYFTTKKFSLDLLCSYVFFRRFAFDSVINNDYNNYVSRSRHIQFFLSPTIVAASFGNGFVPNVILLTGSAGLSVINHRYFNTDGFLFEKRSENRFMYSLGFEYVHEGLREFRIEYLSVGENKFIQMAAVFPIITLFKMAD